MTFFVFAQINQIYFGRILQWIFLIIVRRNAVDRQNRSAPGLSSRRVWLCDFGCLAMAFVFICFLFVFDRLCHCRWSFGFSFGHMFVIFEVADNFGKFIKIPDIDVVSYWVDPPRVEGLKSQQTRCRPNDARWFLHGDSFACVVFRIQNRSSILL